MYADTLPGVSSGALDSKRGLWKGFSRRYGVSPVRAYPQADAKRELLGSPGHSQYSAFKEFFDLFRDKKQVAEDDEGLGCHYFYYLKWKDGPTVSPSVRLLKWLCDSSCDVEGKTIIKASGSFWSRNMETREQAVSFFNTLHDRGADVRIYARARESDPGIERLAAKIRDKSRFGLEKRIPIHYVRVGTDLIYLEYPHTESTVYRLVMPLDLNRVGPKLEDGKTKEDVVGFFDGLVKGVL
ncbi:MAG: hypothetical protein FWB79_06880 [Treponema sp.]|nr:hypothetical protein [Treponema sp.]